MERDLQNAVLRLFDFPAPIPPTFNGKVERCADLDGADIGRGFNLDVTLSANVKSYAASKCSLDAAIDKAVLNMGGIETHRRMFGGIA